MALTLRLPSRPLSEIMSLSSIEAANKEVKSIISSQVKMIQQAQRPQQWQ